ncbi:MAG TPA: NUDIX hydrolase, partial [Planctomycetaceae bacterium]
IDLGGPVRLNEPPIPLGELLVRTEQNPIPEPELSPTKDHYKAGVVIQEADGRVWVIAPKGGFGGYSHTWPKGKVSNIAADASIEIVGSEFQTAAVREAFEETGLSVVLKEHLADLPNDEGNVTRYYLAERVAGGPAYVATPDEVGLVRLMTTDEAAANLYRNGAPDARDQAVLDALRQRREANQAEAAGPAAPVDADLPGSEVGPEPAEEFGYVGHVKLRNGEVWQTPWLDPSVLDAGAIELGNRGLLGRAYDGVFHGWRAWRQMEQQKLNMHHRFTRDYEITPAQVERFHTDLLALSRKYRGVSMQGLAGNFEATPFLGKATHDVRALAAEIFGEGPFLNRRTGRLDDINFPREVTRAYRQAIRLNVLSGVTSHVKAIPGIGGLIIPVTDILYPMLRYTLSFIFKPSERTESGLLNAMRGVQYSGDPFIDAQYARAGLGAGTGVLAEEAGYDLILQGMTSFSPTLGQRGRFGQDPFFYEMPDPA